MRADDQGIFLVRVVMGRIKQPALNGKFVAGPIDRFRLTPQRLETVVVMRNRMARLAPARLSRLRSLRRRNSGCTPPCRAGPWRGSVPGVHRSPRQELLGTRVRPFHSRGRRGEISTCPELTPSHNITGFTISTLSLAAKRLEILHDAVPAAGKVAYLQAPQNPAAAMYAARVKQAADVLGIELVSAAAQVGCGSCRCIRACRRRACDGRPNPN